MKIANAKSADKIINGSILLNSIELSNFTKPLLYKAENASKIADLTGRGIKKHLNPNYEPCFIGKDSSNETSRYLFDKFDVLTYTANQIGGNLCRNLSMIAQAEMGNLRDERFLLPMLESKHYEHRLGAAACLAFLQNAEYESRLYEIAINDVDAGVRKTALWAYAFVKGTHLIELIVRVKEREKCVQVLKMNEQIEQMSLNDIWFI